MGALLENKEDAFFKPPPVSSKRSVSSLKRISMPKESFASTKLCEVMNVDDDFVHTDALQFLYLNLYEWLTTDGYHRLRHRVGERLQTGAKPCCENECVHVVMS